MASASVVRAIAPRTGIVVGLVAALGCAAVSEAQAQNSFQQQVSSYLTRAASGLGQQGYTADRDPVTGNLNGGARESMTIDLTGGTRYAIVGVCDNNCTDVDLRIWDPSGTKLAEDILVDDAPVLEFTATTTGQYRVSVEMATCSTNPCYWGFQVFGRISTRADADGDNRLGARERAVLEFRVRNTGAGPAQAVQDSGHRGADGNAGAPRARGFASCGADGL